MCSERADKKIHDRVNGMKSCCGNFSVATAEPPLPWREFECRREGIAESLYYNWSKEFLEAGKKRLAGTGARAAAVLKKHDRGWGRRRMRYPASEKLEIIRLVEQSRLSARRTLQKLGILR
jgi:transposase-like protein